MVKIPIDIDTITHLVETRARDLERAFEDVQENPDSYGVTGVLDLIERYKDTVCIFQDILGSLTDNEFNKYFDDIRPAHDRISDMRIVLYNLTKIENKMEKGFIQHIIPSVFKQCLQNRHPRVPINKCY